MKTSLERARNIEHTIRNVGFFHVVKIIVNSEKSKMKKGNFFFGGEEKKYGIVEITKKLELRKLTMDGRDLFIKKREERERERER